ncbi:hypothetical protein MRB53_013892 [Persea americana]|uniref:Uncharacterized protein n=1 Tax=Persea americana TaxID=3435 RepID=A0ACC2K9M8_PERAE|nr:hypothetical protein MRB53_013892 [Persea americana]
MFICHNVNPKVNKGVTKEDGQPSSRGNSWNGQGSTTSHNAALPFPRPISKLQVDMGKLAEPNEDIIILKQKIDRFTHEKFKSHLNAIELDDNVKEGDITKPSGATLSEVCPSVARPSDAGPSEDEHLDEGEIHALNEGLGRLEMRVNERFAEMQQSFVDMLNRLRCN